MRRSEGGFRTISRSYAYQASTPDEISFRVDEVQFPSGRVGSYAYAEYPFEVCFVLPLNEDGELLLIRQHRYPIGRALLEIPAGSPQPGESLEDCARRETEEETGFRPRDLERLLSFYPSPGSSDERAHLFLARGLERSDRAPDPDEVTDVQFVTQEEARRMLRDGEIEHAAAALGILMLGARLLDGAQPISGP